MGLTARKSLRLEDAGLDGLFGDHEVMWTDMAQEAYDYVSTSVKKAGEPVRPDDLIPLMTPVLEVTGVLREYLAMKKLRQRYWYEWFGELIVDRVWDELDEDDDEEEGQ